MVDISASLLKQTLSRVSDNFIRLAFHFFPIYFVQIKSGVSEAGFVALVITFFKVVESGLQPIALHWHVRSTSVGVSNSYNLLKKILVRLYALSGVAWFVYFLVGKEVLALFLGERFSENLDEYIPLAIFTAPATFALQYIKGKFESQGDHSPFWKRNACILALFLPLFYLFAENFYFLVVAYSCTFFARLVLNMNKISSKLV